MTDFHSRDIGRWLPQVTGCFYAGSAAARQAGDALEQARMIAEEQTLNTRQVQADDLVLGYAALTEVVWPVDIQAMVHDDPDDDMVLTCALACQADFIVSGKLFHAHSLFLISCP
ncbi:MAG: PIN domain-containing protein [Chloroflexota bacterium]